MKAKKRYFSLVELMVVVVILGLLAGAAGVAVFQHIETARINTTKSDMVLYSGGVKHFRIDTGKMPGSLEDLVKRPDNVKGWKGPYIEGGVIKQDPWGNAFIFEINQDDAARPYNIKSMGKDGVDGTPDDITIWDHLNEAEGGAGASGGTATGTDADLNGL